MQTGVKCLSMYTLLTKKIRVILTLISVVSNGIVYISPNENQCKSLIYKFIWRDLLKSKATISMRKNHFYGGISWKKNISLGRRMSFQGNKVGSVSGTDFVKMFVKFVWENFPRSLRTTNRLHGILNVYMYERTLDSWYKMWKKRNV